MSEPISKPGAGQPDALRRKLTKGGLAAPIILATLASKPVLGGNAPWNCTLSGQLSGNASGRTVETCNTLGMSRSEWLQAPHYTETNPADPSSLGVPNYFYMTDATPGATLTSANTSIVATIHQVLNLSAPSELEYAKRALVLLLNAKNNFDPTLYPLTEAQAKGLYVAAGTHGPFSDIDPALTWQYNPDVMAYIDLLYDPS